ncbi:TonB-dependent receptor plug domain-containing protein [Lysobacter niastensis]|uniref:TonB-dependent receptor n=1 Tax=Lysobacter niastensis TaxID=380629 RepID=A0ABS0B5N4_9GAMM|nr:TonB-dependent receptor [Lysobacter niastensis]MBF6024208.1 TonB-dependent receptor [Lysobacter niastensis]
MNHRNLRTAMRFGLLPAGIAIALAPAFASAQEGAPQQDATTLDKIEVTGSRIRQVDLETAAPVLQLTREDIEGQGFASVADILQNITAAGSPAISRTSPLSSGEAVGGQYIDLRNLGPNRTLILVNGKRLGITNDGLQDVAQIPASMVERIEVLKDGASTIYGSDAIAGVVNIITRKNFEGAEANAYFGQYDQGDGTRQVYDFLLGFTGDRGSVTAGVEYSKEDPVFARDRWFSEVRFPTGDKSDPRPGGTSGITQYGRFSFGGRTLTLNRDVAGLNPADLASYRAFNAATDNSNPNQASTVYSGIERKSIFVNGHFDITDNIGFDTDVLYTDRDSFAQNAGYPFQSAAFDLSSGGLSADSYFNPVGNQAVNLPAGVTPQAIQYIRRGWEVPREVHNSLTTFRFTGAFSGSFQTGDHYWDWDTGYLYNQNKGVQISTGNLNTQAVGLATGPSFLNSQGVVQCGTAANPIPLGFGPGACTPWNPLVPQGYDSPNSLADPNVQAFLYLPGQAISETETKSYFANISGTLFALPAGDVGVAVGYEYRNESGFFSPDALAQTGISTDLAAGPTGGGYSLDEVYAELSIPVLADLPFAKELNLSVATRYSDYDTFGDTTNSKFGFTWKPLDQLLVRGTWSEGFRAPTVADLFGGVSQSFEDYTDPCDTLFGSAAGSAACLADVPAGYRQPAQAGGVAPGPGTQSPIPFLSGSNPNLTPETSESKTLGFVWSPTFAEGLNMSLDWWNIRIDNTIVADTPTDMLNDCYIRGISSRCESSTTFQRDPTTGELTFLSFGGRNAGFQETEGFDFDLNYSLSTDYGKFGLAWLNTYVSKNELKTDNLEGVPQQLNGFGGNFRLRSNMNVTWEKGSWGATYGIRYYSGTKEECFFADRCSLPEYAAPDTGGTITPMNELGSNSFHDLQVRWNAPWNATIAVGANNLWEHYAAPAYAQPNSGFSYYGGFDIGRFMYLKYQQRF